MQILLICKSISSSLGGIQTHVRYLSYTFAQMGHKVYLMTDQRVMEDPLLQNQANIQVIQLPYLPTYRIPFFKKTIDDLAFNIKVCLRLLRTQRRFDVIHIQGRNGILLSLIRRIVRRPLFITFHSLTKLEHVGRHPEQVVSKDDQLHQFLFRRLERIAYKRLPQIISVSQAMTYDMVKLWGSTRQSLNVIPNGTPIQASPITYPKPPTVLFIGRLVINKGVNHLAEMAELLHPDIKIRVIGTGREEKWLKNYITILGQADRFEFLGAIPNWEIRQWIDQAFALIIPSIYEPQGIVALEAMERGIPVVASLTGGLVETIQDGIDGYLVQAGNVAAFAERINQLHHCQALQQQLGQHARKRIQTHYSWKHIAERTLQLYESQLNEPEIK